MKERMNKCTPTLGQVLEQRPPVERSHLPSMPLFSPHSIAKYRLFKRSVNPKRGEGLHSLLLLVVLPHPQSPGFGLTSPSCRVTPGKSPKLCLSCFIPKMGITTDWCLKDGRGIRGHPPQEILGPAQRKRSQKPSCCQSLSLDFRTLKPGAMMSFWPLILLPGPCWVINLHQRW